MGNKSTKKASSTANTNVARTAGNVSSCSDIYDVDWSKAGELGKGHYATVFRGKNKETGQLVAVKRIKRSMARTETLQMEVNALRKVEGHPGVVQLYDVFYDDTYVLLVLELLAGGELFDRIVSNGAYSERSASQHICKIAEALAFMHSQGIVHRDLKPENLVLATQDPEADIKITDFGLSKILKDDMTTMKTVCGTRAYSAPEVNFGGPPRSGHYDEKVDTWSLGVILYVVLGAYHPFDPYGDSPDHVIWGRIVKGEWDFNDPVWDGISDGAKDLIRGLICVDSTKRFGPKAILAHPWIKDHEAVPARSLMDLHQRSSRNMFKSGGITSSMMAMDISPQASAAADNEVL